MLGDRAMRLLIGLVAAMAATGCSEQAGDNAAANQAPAPPEKVPHCFFKDSDTKEWAAKVEGEQVVVTGRVFRSDARYKAILLEPKIDGAVAVVRPSMTSNDTGFAADGNWWDVEARIPATGVEKVEVRCGKKLVTSLDLPRKTG
jgi:hypothetical protein